MDWVRRFSYRAWPPLLLLFVTLVVDVLAMFKILPSSADLFDKVAAIAASAGFFVIALLTLIEHTVFVGVYFPAAVVILVAMGSTYGDLSAALYVFSAILTGQIGGYALSYFIGRRMGAKGYSNTESLMWVAVFLTFIHPHSGAISSFLLGTRRVSWRAFVGFLFLALGVWSTAWAVIAYFGLITIVTEVGWDVVFYVYMVVWLSLVAWQVTAQGRTR